MKSPVFFFVALLFFTLSSGLQSQPIDSSFLAGLNVRNIGPAGMSGRITAVDVDLSHPERIYVGAASGGVWRSDDGGVHWVPIFDDVDVQSIGAIKIDQSNPSVIWVGTGEGNPRNSHNSGAGIYKTLDGGKTWKYMGLKETKLIHRILIDEHDPETVYVGAMGSAWGPTPHRGVYKTTDGGDSWENILFVNDSTGVGDMVMDPHNPNKIFVAMWEFGRKPWTFTSGGKGSGLYLSYDGGKTWKHLTKDDGLPKGNLGRIGLAIARSKPEIVYALIEAEENGLYISRDGGHKWTLVSKRDIGNRPFYYAELYVDPQNENRIWNLWSYVSKSEDGGKTFETILDYGKGVHPDHHAFWQHPEDPNYIIDGNDGGVNISRDRGRNWRFATNIPVGQFYHINIDDDYPYNVYGGMQDNGSWIGPAYVLKNGGIRNADWREVYFGDGFDVMPRRDNNRFGWAMSQGGNLSYYDKETGNNEYNKPVHPDGVELRYNWNAALAQDPFHTCGIYYGSQFVHKSLDCGKSWEIISPDLTTNDSTKQRQFESGGLTIDDTEAENHTTILCIEPSGREEGVIWVGTDDGNVQLTRDGGKTWSKVSGRMPGMPKLSWVPQIHASAHSGSEAFVVVNNYRQNDWAPYLYHTADYGASWTRLVNKESVGGFVVSVVQDPEVPNLLFLGADDGLYVSINKGKNWQKWPGKKFPSVQVRDLKIQERDRDLVIGTFGRAIWVVDNITPLRQLAKSESMQKRDFALMAGPPAYQANIRSVDGIRFTADAEFRGDNKSTGLPLSIWVKPKEKEKAIDKSADIEKEKEKRSGKKLQKEGEMQIDSADVMAQDSAKVKKKEKEDEAKFVILNADRDTVRRYNSKLSEGLHTHYWNMRADGVRLPTRRKIDGQDRQPSGNPVLPGTYSVYVEYRDFSDSASVVVQPDPRVSGSMAALRTQLDTLNAMDSIIHKAFLAFERLKAARKTVELVNSVLENQPDSTQKEMKKTGKDMLAKIDSLERLYMLPEDTKGYQDSDATLNSRLSTADAYLSRNNGALGANALNALKLARAYASDTLSEVNAFLTGPWIEYTGKVESLTVRLTEPLEPVYLK